MSKAPKVSIVCVTYNQEKYIRQTLEGFIAQKTDFDFKIIVADDCSTDSTPAIIEQYAKAHPGLFEPILRRKNIGVLANFVDALRAATGEYIALCEGDDYWTDPKKIQKQAEFLDRNKQFALCFHPVKVVFENHEAKDYISPDPKDGRNFTTEELLRRNFIQTNSVMYRRQTYKDMPADIMPVDWYLHLYHAQFGEIGFIDEVMSVYRRHADGVWWESYRDVDKIWRKHGLAWLSLYIEILKLYKGEVRYKDITEGAVITSFNKLVEIDRKYGEKLLEQALKAFPDSAEIFVQDLLKQAVLLDDHSKEQAKIIDHYVNLSKDLQAKNDHLKRRNARLEAKLLVRLESVIKHRIKGKHR